MIISETTSRSIAIESMNTVEPKIVIELMTVVEQMIIRVTVMHTIKLEAVIATIIPIKITIREIDHRNLT
jgi:hypothetical protein